ncbi:MAG TPA: FAD-binding oxidoreductase, partial [Nannocystis sp.]
MKLGPAILLASALAGCGRVAPPVSITETRKIERGQTTCEGVSFAVGCGDRKCDARGGETTTTCPSDCVVAKLVSYNEQTLCDSVHEVVEPTDTAGVAAVIRRARAEGRQVRVGGRQHTSNGQLCTSGIIVSTARMKHALHIERFEGFETVVTEPGIRMGDLTDWLDARGRSLGFAVLGTRDPTIAGAIATGSHGSSPQHNSVVSNLVQSIELVDANGDVREYTRGT